MSVRLFSLRERGEIRASSFQKKMYITDQLLRSLSLACQLEGHTGCVNCLEWSQNGRMLASGSDDFTLRLWNPFTYQQLLCHRTGHTQNIFSVKFIPDTTDLIVATGAADSVVRVHDLKHKELVRAYHCHTNRVKRLAVLPLAPYLLFSSGEDGTVRSFDLRQPHTCSPGSDCSNVLINLNSESIKGAGQNSKEAKCIAVNPTRPYIAVGGSDPFVRIFDFRMLNAVAPEVVKVFGPPKINDSTMFYCVPGHLPYQSRRNVHISTYITFDHTGNEILVNMGQEQLYLFDINNDNISSKFSLEGLHRQVFPKSDMSLNGFKNGKIPPHTLSDSYLNDCVQKLKETANDLFYKEKYHEAITLYNKALSISPGNVFLLGNRALALMKRDWTGDLYAALRDCQRAIAGNREYTKAHLRLIRCLLELKWNKEAVNWFKSFEKSFPIIKEDNSFKKLSKDINAYLHSSKPTRQSPEAVNSSRLSDQEIHLEQTALDFVSRYCGHCNTSTDIKEANFFGPDGQFVMAGSDDGSFFIWDKKTTNLVRVMVGDGNIVNCLQPHPAFCLLASSGIDNSIKLWSPGNPSEPNVHSRADFSDISLANQKRMRLDPFEFYVMMNMMPQSLLQHSVATLLPTDPAGVGELTEFDTDEENEADRHDDARFQMLRQLFNSMN